MAAILESMIKISPKSFFMNSLNGWRKKLRIPASALLFAHGVLLSPRLLPAQHTLPTAQEVEAFVERAHSEHRVGEKVAVPRRIFKELMARLTADLPPYCDVKSLSNLGGHRIPFSSNQPMGLTVAGQSQCFCSPAGNCEFWIFQLRNGKYREILDTNMVQMFGFLKTRKHGYPDLVTWSHGSATMYGGRLFRFDGERYVATGSWEEEYEFKGDNGQIVKPDKPRVTSYFSGEDELPEKLNQ